jgi:hypothetical protein
MGETIMATATNVSKIDERPTAGLRPKWTVMIYLAGDNNLSAECVRLMQDLEDADHRPEVRVIACYDSNAPLPKGSRYLDIQRQRQKANFPMGWGLHNDMVRTDERNHRAVEILDFTDFTTIRCTEVPTTAPTAPVGLDRFLQYATENHDAERFMLILFGHGGAVAGNSFLQSDNPPSFVRLAEFSDIIRKHFDGEERKLDILGFDNCVMNSVEAAWEIKDSVDYTIGSQGLVLTAAWPFRKLVNQILRDHDRQPEEIARGMAKICARNVLDFALMDRSSEQAVCDLTTLRRNENLVSKLRKLAGALTLGCALDYDLEQPKYPEIVDMIRLARLEAQTFWDETFVDIGDFCELLIQRANRFLQPIEEALRVMQTIRTNSSRDFGANIDRLQDWDLSKQAQNIHDACVEVLAQLREIVQASYYVGSASQYSHGMSVYYPWTLPREIVVFEPDYSGMIPADGDDPPVAEDFKLITAFQEYSSYKFAESGLRYPGRDLGADNPGEPGWADFLLAYFGATLRRVRCHEVSYQIGADQPFAFSAMSGVRELAAPAIDLQKTSSDVGGVRAPALAGIKNYPGRSYLSPFDKPHVTQLNGGIVQSPPISYLGWNIRGLVSESIGVFADNPTDADPELSLKP